MQLTQFRHEAMLYAGPAAFVDRTAAFLRDAVEAEEPALVVVSAAKIGLLRSKLGPAADRVQFADMAEVGQNPARIIPAWRDFVAQHADGGRRVRGIGEPIWAGRTPEELVECERHEALVNLAFDGNPPWWLVCPYDTRSLPHSVIDEAYRNHPFVWNGAGNLTSETYQGLESVARPLDAPLSPPPPDADAIAFGDRRLSGLRQFVSVQAASFRVGPARAEDLVLAANEAATNSVRHGGGRGTLSIWLAGDTVIFEVRDEGRIDQPMAGRVRPSPERESGYGLWLVHQICDLVQVRTFPTGSVVRMHLRIH